MRWEYRVVKYNKSNFWSASLQAEPLEELLNELGREGWELVQAAKSGRYQMNGDLLLVMKRSRSS